jgi:hypothetical protein
MKQNELPDFMSVRLVLQQFVREQVKGIASILLLHVSMCRTASDGSRLLLYVY